MYIYVIFMIFCIAFLIFGDTFLPTLGTGLLLGRNEEQIGEFNGRTALWVECIDYAKKRPICGYGFKGFWTVERARVISDVVGWEPKTSHSMYIENLLSLGLVGLGVFLMMVLLAWWKAGGACLNRNNVGMGIALSLLALLLAYGVLGPTISGLGFLTYLFFVVLFSIARESVLGESR
jgi:O-antigen ligase